MKHKKVLITGASGFIGSFLCEKGLELGYEVWAGVRKSSSKQYLQNPEINFIELIFEDKEKLKSQIEEFTNTNGRFEYIIHNAGTTKASVKEDYMNINYQNTRHFIEVLEELSLLPEKLIFTSSLAALGPGKENSIEPITENQEPKPVNLYGKSKYKAEEYIRSVKNLNFIIIRPTGVYGPRDKEYFFVFKMINNGIEFYLGSDRQKLTFIYVKDLSTAYFKALESNAVKRSYLLSEAVWYETRSFVKILKEVMNKKTVRAIIPFSVIRILANINEFLGKIIGKHPNFNRDKLGILKVDNWICDTKPLKEELDFEPEYDLKKGLKETLIWYKLKGWLK